MPLHILTDALWFPPLQESLDDGLLAIGGDLSTERLLLAYRKGIFPWYDGDMPLWWSPDPRFVLFPEEVKISKSMKQVLKHPPFTFTINRAFAHVIQACRYKERKGQDGTWINNEVEFSFCELHKMGYAHSAEAWLDNELVGGLYGIRLGNVFFGESMFSYENNASKFAFIKYIETLWQQGVELIDCQVHTSHLESLGARMIDRKLFIELLDKHIL